MLPMILVLASGRGARFLASGGGVHKLRAGLAGAPVLAWTLQAVKDSGLPWHLEQATHAGMGESLAAAVRATSSAPGWLVLPADLPLVQPGTLVAVAQAWAADPTAVVVPHCEGQRGHPVAFGAQHGPALMALQGDVGAVQILQAARAAGHLRPLVVDDPGVYTDIDTLDDLNRAQQLVRTWGRRPPRDDTLQG